MILADGVGRFCDDLGVDPSDIVMLVLSWRLNAAAMCEYSRDEFVGGLQQLGCDSVDKLRRRLPEVRADLRDAAKWREIYNYAFGWAKEKNQKCLQLDVAVGMWQLLFSDDRAWEHVGPWCEFLQAHHNRAISRDTWVQLFEFARAVKPDFSNFDESAAWPYLIDEFVDHMRQQGGMQE
ncbi:MAG: Cullin binding-domain-containing protein [Monoraphidium minutum]|nr:MAG: Cullin binding-domain-containing protein [Monoraphidium minutum]